MYSTLYTIDNLDITLLIVIVYSLKWLEFNDASWTCNNLDLFDLMDPRCTAPSLVNSLTAISFAMFLTKLTSSSDC